MTYTCNVKVLIEVEEIGRKCMNFASMTYIIRDERLQQSTLVHFKAIQLTINSPVMGYNTENGATLLELSEKSQFQRKRRRKLLLNIERKESKKLKIFQKLLEQMNQNPQYNRSRQSESSANREEIYTRKLTKNQAYLEILVPYLTKCRI